MLRNQKATKTKTTPETMGAESPDNAKNAKMKQQPGQFENLNHSLFLCLDIPILKMATILSQVSVMSNSPTCIIIIIFYLIIDLQTSNLFSNVLLLHGQWPPPHRSKHHNTDSKLTPKFTKKYTSLYKNHKRTHSLIRSRVVEIIGNSR